MDDLVVGNVKLVEVFIYQGGVSVQKNTFRDFYEGRDYFSDDPEFLWSWMQMIIFFDDGTSETWFKLPRKGDFKIVDL